jgi:trk system potassium uptake protein TrkH
MGIILLTAALMPILGVGSFALIKAETPGPEKERLTPNIAVTAKLLWGIYCALTVIVILLYRSGGMNWFDAVCHGFTTIATGGVSTKNAGIASFNSPAVEWTTTIFMLLGAVNFNLYFKLLKGNFRDIRYNSELRAYLLIFLCASTIIVLSLIPHYGSVSRAIRYGTFQTAAILTTTGNAIADYEKWPALTQAVLLCLMCIGGCSGSTAGGIKVIRHTVLFKQTSNEVRRILFPQGVFSIQLNHKVGRKDVVYGVAGFVFLYMVVVTITALITASSGTDTLSAFSAALSTTGNIGLGFGAVGPSRFYGAFPDYVKWTFSLAMIAGRLELWTMLIFFNPEYWRR